MSVQVIEAKFLLLEVCTTTLSPSIWHMKSLHFSEAKFLLRKVYYYIESQYLTPWCQYTWLRQSFYCWRSVLLHWIPVSYTMMSVFMIEAKFLLVDVSTTTLSPSIWHMKSVHIPEAMFLLLKVSITTLCQNIWHMKSVHITETKVLLLDVSTTTLSPSIWHNDVSTHHWGQVSTARGQYYYIKSNYLTHEVSKHHWGQVSTARGQYYYIESKFLTHEVSTHHWGQGSTARCHNYYIESQILTTWCQYTWLRQSFFC